MLKSIKMFCLSFFVYCGISLLLSYLFGNLKNQLSILIGAFSFFLSVLLADLLFKRDEKRKERERDEMQRREREMRGERERLERSRSISESWNRYENQYRNLFDNITFSPMRVNVTHEQTSPPQMIPTTQDLDNFRNMLNAVPSEISMGHQIVGHIKDEENVSKPIITEEIAIETNRLLKIEE